MQPARARPWMRVAGRMCPQRASKHSQQRCNALHGEDDLASRLTLTEEIQRRRRLFKRICRTHDRGDDARRDHRVELALRLGEERWSDAQEGSPRGADDIDIPEQDPIHLDAGDSPVRETDDDQSSLGSEASDALVESFTTDGVEDGIDTESVVLRSQGRHPVPLRIEDVMRAGPFRDVHLVGPGGDRDDLGPEPAPDLNGGGADPTRGAMDRDAVARPDPTPADRSEA